MGSRHAMVDGLKEACWTVKVWQVFFYTLPLADSIGYHSTYETTPQGS